MNDYEVFDLGDVGRRGASVETDGNTKGPPRAEIEEAMRYHHPEKTLATLPGGPEIRDETLAPFFGADVETYQKIRHGFVERARRCARELLEDPRFARLVDALPFEPGSTVIGLGDSITDDYQSWFEILRHLLDGRRSDGGVRLINAGISGDTTAGLLGRILELLAEEPDWLIVLIGTNDAAFVRDPPTKPRVSPEETAKNLHALRSHIQAHSSARLAWMTPPPAIEARVNKDAPPAGPVWSDGDLEELAKLVHEVAGEDPLVDLRKTFGSPATPHFLLPDGLHPSLEGQKAITAAVVERLSREH